MSQQEILTELFTIPAIEFANHLTPDNNRILFSGRYGVGKTTFIDWFFKQKGHAEKYNTIHLFPVNYSIASNEDIMRYIKMDILIHLLENTDVKIEHLDISVFEYIPHFIRDHAMELFLSSLSVYALIKTTGLSGGGKTGFSSSGTIFAKIEELRKKFGAEYKKSKENVSELKKVKEFANELILKEGSLYEFNFISELIVDLLKQWRTLTGKEEVVLILDDLDRIDPNHIFRLFNVFAAHFDHPTSNEPNNKFGFDKVMFVGDINNLRNIFHAQYGADVDFSGYIDKFYTKSVYSYNNIDSVKDIVEKRIRKFTFYFDDHVTYVKENRYMHLNQLIKHDYKQELSLLIAYFISIGKLNLRNLSPKTITITNKNLTGRVGNWGIISVVKLECLAQIVGSVRKLKECLQASQLEIGWSQKWDNYNYNLAEVLPLFQMHTHQFNTQNGEISVRINGNSFNYILSQPNMNQYYGEKIRMEQYDADTFRRNPKLGPSIFEVYLEAVKELERIGYFT